MGGRFRGERVERAMVADKGREFTTSGPRIGRSNMAERHREKTLGKFPEVIPAMRPARPSA